MPSLRITAGALRAVALGRGASVCGIARAGALAEHARFLEACANPPSGLAYLLRVSSPRPDIRTWFAPAKSVMMCAFRYWRPGLDHDAELLKAGDPLEYLRKTGRRARPEFVEGVTASGLNPRISRFALAPEYHKDVSEKLGQMLADIRAQKPDIEGKAFVDTSPVMEKEIGRLAGLGFRGKNTLLISKELGSYFFLGGLALSCEIPPEEFGETGPAAPGCGSCEKCLAACPTGALREPGVLDAERCISYWTTQSKTAAPEDIIKRSGGYIYGCDICQEVCPYNKP